MAKTRVSELAKKYGIPSKEALEKLGSIGEFAKTASSSIEPPAVKKFEDAFGAELQARMKPAAETAEAPAKKAAAPRPGPKPKAARARACRSGRGAGRGRSRACARAGRAVVEAPGPPRRPSRAGADGNAGCPEARCRAVAQGARAAARRQAERHPASGQQPVRPEPGHGASPRARRRVRATPDLPVRVRRPVRVVRACRAPTRR